MAGLDDAQTDKDKMCKAIGDIETHGVKVSRADINKSSYYFEPDESNDTILYGLKAIADINGELATAIIDSRPYSSPQDFFGRVMTNKSQAVSLIKSGSFDDMATRRDVMEWYLRMQSSPKTRLTMQNLPAIVERGMLPRELGLQRRVFNFNKSLKARCKSCDVYKLDNVHYKFFSSFFDVDELSTSDDSMPVIECKKWQKLYTKAMVPVKEYLTAHQDELLKAFNDASLQELLDKYASGPESRWEMESMGFYASEHELASIDMARYSASDFNDLPEEPVVTYVSKNGRESYQLARIIGTVIGKNDTKSIFTLLTIHDGPVEIRLPRDVYAQYNRRYSGTKPDGKKYVAEYGWFDRGTRLMVTGFRRGRTFIARTYRNANSSLVYKITDVRGNVAVMTDRRFCGDESD